MEFLAAIIIFILMIIISRAIASHLAGRDEIPHMKSILERLEKGEGIVVPETSSAKFTIKLDNLDLHMWNNKDEENSWSAHGESLNETGCIVCEYHNAYSVRIFNLPGARLYRKIQQHMLKMYEEYESAKQS